MQRFHDETTTGDSMYRINFEAKAVGQMAVALPPLAQSVLTLIGMFVIACKIDLALALLSLVGASFSRLFLGILLVSFTLNTFEFGLPNGEVSELA